jgi:uncharacterized damage-inducible protein DinB
MARPQESESAVFYHKYINYTKGDSVLAVMQHHVDEIYAFYTTLPASKADYAYAADKWTIKDLLQHVIDAERIFAYRLLRVARKDATPLAGFEENDYAITAQAGNRAMETLVEEFIAVRASSDLLVKSLTPEQLRHSGTASNNFITANALVYILYGHLLHHKAIIAERYL